MDDLFVPDSVTEAELLSLYQYEVQCFVQGYSVFFSRASYSKITDWNKHSLKATFRKYCSSQMNNPTLGMQDLLVWETNPVKVYCNLSNLQGLRKYFSSTFWPMKWYVIIFFLMKLIWWKSNHKNIWGIINKWCWHRWECGSQKPS